MAETTPLLQIAEDFIQYTDCPVFLSGKAGTGKTTFLKHIKQHTHKSCVVVAPTGVAAINAGGMTIHSFLQLPFSPFIPATNAFNQTSPAVDKHQLLGKIKYTKDRIQLLQQLELLVIDEISMVRCDLLDEIDLVLRYFRKKEELPFGGVQVLLIGDLLQLAPVAKREEWELLSPFYDSPYFFSSRVWKMQPVIHIELQAVYRQKNPAFIDILNRVRNNNLDEKSIELLREAYQPTFEPPKHEHYITLTTHNKTADAINEKALQKIAQPVHRLQAIIEGEFQEHIYPADSNLLLKKSAQVMFLKNDTATPKKYYNGKVGVIEEITDDKIIVRCDDTSIQVKKEKWNNVRYRLNAATQQMEEEVIGCFTQFPLRLAWAITIHKSQGLTFEKVMIDPGAAFAPGQVYVALSRCTSLEGMVLLSPINFRGLGCDPVVQAFLSEVDTITSLQKTLADKKSNQEKNIITQLFSFTQNALAGKALIQWVMDNKNVLNRQAPEWATTVENKLEEISKVLLRFQPELQRYLQDAIPISRHTVLLQRLQSAAVYFIHAFEQLIHLLEQSPVQTDNKAIAQKFQANFEEFYEGIFLQKHLLQSCQANFSPDQYYSLKKNYQRPAFHVNPISPSAKTTYTSSHPVLYKRLIQLRNQLADEKKLPVYRIASFKTMEEMITFLPQRKEALQHISGFGKIKTNQFGDHFIQLIRTYCEENNIAAPEMNFPEKKKKEKKETKPHSRDESWQLFRDGLRPQEIAIRRNLTIETIQGHLAYFVREGKLDVTALLSQEKLKKIEGQFLRDTQQNIGTLKSKLGSAISYGEITIALAHLRKTEK